MEEAVDELIAEEQTDVVNPLIAPHPPVTLEEWEATKDLRCRYCPHPSDPFPSPPQLPLAEAPWTTFRCGCRIHTACAWIRLVIQEYDLYGSCPVCNESVLTEEQRRFLRQTSGEESPVESRIKKLWEEDQVFCEEMRQVAKEGRKVGPAYQEYLKDKAAIRREWRAAVLPSIHLIRHHKQIFTKRMKDIQSRRKYLLAQGRYKRKLFQFLNTYDIEQYNLNRLMERGVKGMPKLRPAMRWGNWREKSWRMFRVRI